MENSILKILSRIATFEPSFVAFKCKEKWEGKFEVSKKKRRFWKKSRKIKVIKIVFFFSSLVWN